MSISLRIFIPLLLFAAATVAGILSFDRQVTKVSEELNGHLVQYQKSLTLVQKIRLLAAQRRATAIDYKGGPTEPTFDRLASLADQMDIFLDQLEGIHADVSANPILESSIRVRQAERLIAAAKDAAASMPELHAAFIEDVASGSPRAETSRRLMDQQHGLTTAVLADLEAFYATLVDVVVESTNETIDTATRSLFILVGVLLVVALAASLYLGTTVVRPLRRLSEAARGRARGRTGAFPEAERRDAIGELSRGLTRMVQEMEASHNVARREEQRFRTVLQTISLGLAVVDHEGTIVLANQRFAAMTAEDHARLLGANLAKYLSGIDLDQALQKSGTILGGGEGYVSDPDEDAIRVLGKDGSSFPADVDIAPIMSDGQHGSDEALSLVAVTDVSERAELERTRARYRIRLEQDVALRTAQLSQRTDELQQLIQDLEGFSYSVSHDLRAPLRAIDGFIDMLLEDHADALDPDGRRMFGVVQDNAKKMGNLIDDILALSRAGRLEVQWSSIDMNDLVAGVWNDLASDQEHRSVEFEKADLPTVVGDARAVRQVVVNLLDNALKFTQNEDVAKIGVDAVTDDEFATISIRDNGVGFKQEFADKLFVLFQRLHGMDEFQGTGVGLAIVKRFITKHGGKVEASGTYGEGATFSFSLPMEPPATLDSDADPNLGREPFVDPRLTGPSVPRS